MTVNIPAAKITNWIEKTVMLASHFFANSGTGAVNITGNGLKDQIKYESRSISDPKDLGPALRRALDVVRKGEPALLDVITQPR